MSPFDHQTGVVMKPAPLHNQSIPGGTSGQGLKIDGPKTDNISILSGTTLGAAELAFNPGKSLHIQTLGHSAEHFPTPTLLQTFICNPDGSIVFRSTRPKRLSDNCILTDADDRELISTEFLSGPGRDPVMHLLDGFGNTTADIKTASKITSRSQKFILPDGREFTWDYKKGTGFGAKGKSGTALILSIGKQRFGALIRKREARIAGSGKLAAGAGNGGELVLADGIGESGLSEEIVVASCLMMLKREVDRRWYTTPGDVLLTYVWAG